MTFCEKLAWTTCTPARQARHGSYRARRGLEDRHFGQMGLLQQLVVNNSKGLEDDQGGSDDEQARQSVVSRFMFMTGER
jgi:hypothetical protein